MKLRKINSSLAIFLIYFFVFSFFDAKPAKPRVENNLYNKENFSNYFSGTVSFDNNDFDISVNKLKKIEKLGNIHKQYINEYIFALVHNQKISEAFKFSKNIQKEKSELSFYTNLLLALNFLNNNNYNKSMQYLKKIINNQNTPNFQQIIVKGIFNYLNAFNNFSEKDTFFLESRLTGFNKINEAFYNCYLGNLNAEEDFLKLVNSEDMGYSRYDFFYLNYLVSKDFKKKASNFLNTRKEKHQNNLLFNQGAIWVNNKNYKKIKNIFNCRKPKHVISEYLYLIANLYSSEEKFNLSNFYLNLSIYFNKNFSSNKFLLAENLFNLGDFKNSEKNYRSFDSKDEIFYWYAQKRLFWILKKTKNEERALDFIVNNFDKIKNFDAVHFYDLANFYKNLEKYSESIQFYSKSLEILEKKNELYAEILYRRGGSYERLKLYQESEKDLLESLKIVEDDPYVLNYLAYSWIERNKNINKSMKMLEKAHSLKDEDPYIADSLAWANFLVGKYDKAEKLQQKALKLMPNDPIVNDHYGDILWKQNKKLEARYFWKYVLSLEDAEEEMKKKIKEKLIFGLNKKS